MNEKTIENVLRADDLSDLLDHIAWEQTVQPALDKYRENYQNLLVKSVLGQAVVDNQSGQIISKEMLAGRIEGIDWIKKFLLHVLRKGEASKADMASYNVQ